MHDVIADGQDGSRWLQGACALAVFDVALRQWCTE
jgi:hypothetical protein